MTTNYTVPTFEAIYDCGCYCSCNLICADTLEDATKYAEAYAARYNYEGVKVVTLADWQAAEYMRKGMPSTGVCTVREFCEGITDIDGNEITQETENEQEADTMNANQTETRTEKQPENLRSTCRAALDNIHAYIMRNVDTSGYDIPQPETWHDAAHDIWNTFQAETKYNRRNTTSQERFFDWAQGLPSILDTCYYYNRSAVDDLAGILNTSADRLEKYRCQGEKAERAAEKELTWLIYREIEKEVRR